MLNEDVWKVYRVKGITPGYYVFPGRFGEFDLRTITMQKANGLFAKGFPYLEKIAEPAVIKSPANELKKKIQ